MAKVILITQRTLVRRINAVLEPLGETIEPYPPGDSEGEYYCCERLGGRITAHLVDLLELANQMKLIKAGEEVVFR